MFASTTTMIIRLLTAATLIAAAAAQAGQINPQLVGTWTTKSRVVHTGPGFYDPVKDKMTEPSLTGISYSFTQDGWFEEAYYRAGSNGAAGLRIFVEDATDVSLQRRTQVAPRALYNGSTAVSPRMRMARLA